MEIYKRECVCVCGRKLYLVCDFSSSFFLRWARTMDAWLRKLHSMGVCSDVIQFGVYAWNCVFFFFSKRLNVFIFMTKLFSSLSNTVCSCIYLLALLTAPSAELDSWCISRSTQHDQIMPPEHRSSGFPPPSTHDMLRPHSKRRPLNLHVCGITAEKYTYNHHIYG